MASPRFAWGIDVGNRALKAIRIVRDGDQFRIDDIEIIEHDHILSQAGDNKESLIQSALANFAQKHPQRGGVVSIGLSGTTSFARFIKLPPVDPSKIGDIVRFEAVQQIPFPLEEVEWSYQLFQAPDSPEIEVGIFAIKRETVNGIIKYFTDVGLEVTVVQTNPLAVYNGLQYDDRLEGTTMIIDIGAENSDLIIAEGDGIWMRSIPVGGNNFTDALVKAFKLKFPKAEELKRNAATSKYGRQILQAMKPVFSDLVSEIQRSIGFYASTHRDSRIAKVLALGGTFRLPGLQKYLQQNLQLDVVRIDRLNAPIPTDARFAAAFNDNILSSIGAYGLALQGMGLGVMKSSLLPAHIRRERMWRDKTRWFALAASLFVAGTAIPVAKWYVDQLAYDSQEPVRRQIATVKAQAQSYDSKWRDIESSGSDDRTLISNSVKLLTDRDVTLDISKEVVSAFHGAPSATPSSIAAKPPPRSARQDVELVGFTMRYEPDLSLLLSSGAATSGNPDSSQLHPPGQSGWAIPDDRFNERADKIENFVSGEGANNTPIYNTSGSYREGPRPLGPVTGGPPPTFSGRQPDLSSASGSDQSGSPRRGFLVTVLCRTPAGNPTAVVAKKVVDVLRLRVPGAAGMSDDIAFRRVSIAFTDKVTDPRTGKEYPIGKLAPKPLPIQFVPPIDPALLSALQNNQNPGFGPGSLPPGASGRTPATGGPPLVGPNGQPIVDYTQLYPDPAHPGESTSDDALVVVLAAVEIDPKADAVAAVSPGR